MARLLQRLKNRKPVQWALAYSATAFALIQVVASRFDWPPQLERTAILTLAIRAALHCPDVRHDPNA